MLHLVEPMKSMLFYFDGSVFKKKLWSPAGRDWGVSRRSLHQKQRNKLTLCRKIWCDQWRQQHSSEFKSHNCARRSYLQWIKLGQKGLVDWNCEPPWKKFNCCILWFTTKSSRKSENNVSSV